MTVKWTALLLIAPTLLLVSCSDVEDGYGTKGAITPPTTIAMPPGGTYNAPLTVTLVTDRLATIYYTTDGDEPDKFSNVYTGHINILNQGATVLKFFAIDEAGNWEQVKTETYLILMPPNPGWHVPVNVSDDPTESTEPAIAAGPDRVAHIAWIDFNRDTYVESLCYANSTDWTGTRINIPSPDDIPSRPSIAVDVNSIAHMAWEVWNWDAHDHDIYYANSTDWFGTRINVSNTPESYSEAPEIVVDSNGTAHIVWEEYDDGIAYANSANWAATEKISWGHCPSITVDTNDVVYVAWHEYEGWTHPSNNIHYAKSTSGCWTIRNIVGSDEDEYCPSIAVGYDGIIHVAWMQNLESPYSDIYCANSTDYWDYRVNVSNTPEEESVLRGIVVDQTGTVHAVWDNGYGYYNDPSQIYYANSTDWTATRTNMSNTGYDSNNAAVALDSRMELHIVWEERLGGSSFSNTDIIYMKSRRYAD